MSLFLERLKRHIENVPDREMTMEHYFFNGFV